MPQNRYFVVGEKSWQEPPNAYIYQYPSLTLEQTLEHGTEQAYSAAAFNQAGDRLATVGSYPDYMLTVWDWRSGCTLLRSKAFSQEVYRVSFCPYADGALTTSGMTVAQSGGQVARQSLAGAPQLQNYCILHGARCALMHAHLHTMAGADHAWWW